MMLEATDYLSGGQTLIDIDDGDQRQFDTGIGVVNRKIRLRTPAIHPNRQVLKQQQWNDILCHRALQSL